MMSSLIDRPRGQNNKAPPSVRGKSCACAAIGLTRSLVNDILPSGNVSIPVPHICMATSRITLPPLLVSRTLASQLLRFYDYPDPRRPGRIIKGYDGPHAVRTARMCAAVAARLGHPLHV